ARRSQERRIGARLSILVVHFVANLVVAPAGEASGFLVGFRHEVWLLPLKLGLVFCLQRIGRKMEVEDSIFVSREFQNEQSLRCAKIEIDVASAHRGVFGGLSGAMFPEWNYGPCRAPVP